MSINSLLYRLTANMPVKVIKLNDKPYLARYYVGKLWGVTFYLHQYLSADSERHLHNHPWTTSRAFVLTGDYTEEVVSDLCPHSGNAGCITYFRNIKWYNRIDGSRFHRIVWVKSGTWTLFTHGGRAVVNSFKMASRLKGWGFLNSDGRTTTFTPHLSMAVKGAWKTNGKVRGDV